MPPPTKLELTLAGKAKEEQSSREGFYVLRDSLVNGYPYWLKTGNGSQAIWFEKVSSAWLVGLQVYLGTNAGPKGKDSYPNEIKQGWQYGDGTNWHEVPSSDVIFKAIGTISKLFSKPFLLS